MKAKNNDFLSNTDAIEEKREYKIYNYFKGHPTLLVSIISAMVIIVSFILNSALYATTCAYLNNWGFDSHSMSINTTGKTLIFAVESIGLFATCFLQHVLRGTYARYLEDIEYVIKLGVLCDEIKKNMKKEDRTKNKKIRLLTVNVFNAEGELLENIKAIECLKSMQKKTKKESKKKLKQTSFLINFFMLLLWISMLIMIMPSVHIFVIGLFSVFVTSIYTAVAYIKEYFMKKNKRKRIIKKEFESREDPITLFLNEKEKVLYPLDKVVKLKFREFFHDDGIASIIAFLVSCIALLFVWLYVIGIIQNDRVYPITSIGESTYVILYENEDYYYLEKAQIQESTLLVETSVQRVIKKDDIEYQMKEFESVEKLKVNK